MSRGWMRIREAAHLMGVSQSTVRRRMDAEELRQRVGPSGRQEVFLPAKMRRELEAAQTESCPPGHLERGKSVEEQEEAPCTAATDQDAAADEQPTPNETATTDAGEAPDLTPGGDMIKRYERMAGGSVILAQQHSDELHKHNATAFEQLAHTRNQLRQLRRVALAGWVSCAAAVTLGLIFSISFGVGMAKSQASAKASATQAENAELEVKNMQRTAAANIAADARRVSVDEAPNVRARPVSVTAVQP